MAANLGTAKRYPLQGLLDATGLGEHALGQRVGLTGTSLIRAREHGLLEAQADLYACRAGWVPWAVWPEWIVDVIADCSIECADDGCSVRFVPKRGNQIYCCPRCSHRAPKRNYARRRYQTDPVAREAKKAKVRAYRQSALRARKVWQAAYYRENRERLLAQKAAYREANREALRVRQREYRARKAAA